MGSSGIFCVMMLWSCERKVVGCERVGKGSHMLFVVLLLCDDVVRELFANGRDEVSRIE